MTAWGVSFGSAWGQAWGGAIVMTNAPLRDDGIILSFLRPLKALQAIRLNVAVPNDALSTARNTSFDVLGINAPWAFKDGSLVFKAIRPPLGITTQANKALKSGASQTPLAAAKTRITFTPKNQPFKPATNQPLRIL